MIQLRILLSFAAVCVSAGCSAEPPETSAPNNEGPPPVILPSVTAKPPASMPSDVSSVAVDPGPPRGDKCTTAADCHGATPKVCIQCPLNSKSNNGCSHWACKSNACVLASCE